ncbi:hypothetical protein HPP92_000818 [Vanilla planifolia]|uniref:Fe2OG dioxygenase domain-containing protein n=1 Tax=Vanilla planifolia TaxID=51239 RepID=A0A835S2Z3_VANPL|nr:hypothetical protein HPP92_000818 [Vanilla planifolia]
MEADPFLQNFDSSDLKIAEEFLTNWLPFLTRGLCDGCAAAFHDRIKSLNSGHERNPGCFEADVDGGGEGNSDAQASVEGFQEGHEHVEATGWDPDLAHESSKVRLSWADMAQQDELEEEGGEEEEEMRRNNLEDREGVQEEVKPKKIELSREQRERIRFTSLGRKKDFVCLERIDGKVVNILEGLELHTGVFSAAEQKRIVDFVYELQKQGRNNELGEHTYSEPKKWMRGKGRVTIQFGCCYNYAEKNGMPPGIMRDAVADPIPSLFKVMIKRLIGWHVMPTSCVPDSCIVNIYEPGDCIPPHIDSHDFVRPFCTVSFLSECNIVLGSNLQIVGPGEFAGSYSISLPVGSVFVLNGNGADVAKHCVPAVPSKRISITFRKMDKKKWPFGFRLEPDLQNIRPYDSGAGTEPNKENKQKEPFVQIRTIARGKKSNGRTNGAKNRWDSNRSRTSATSLVVKKPYYHPSPDADSTTGQVSMDTSCDSRAMFDSDRCTVETFGQSHYGWTNEDSGANFDVDMISAERRVQVEQRRIDAPNDVDVEDDSFASSHPIAYTSRPQVRIRTLKNNQRRMRVNL